MSYVNGVLTGFAPFVLIPAIFYLEKINRYAFQQDALTTFSCLRAGQPTFIISSILLMTCYIAFTILAIKIICAPCHDAHDVGSNNHPSSSSGIKSGAGLSIFTILSTYLGVISYASYTNNSKLSHTISPFNLSANTTLFTLIGSITCGVIASIILANILYKTFDKAAPDMLQNKTTNSEKSHNTDHLSKYPPTCFTRGYPTINEFSSSTHSSDHLPPAYSP